MTPRGGQPAPCSTLLPSRSRPVASVTSSTGRELLIGPGDAAGRAKRSACPARRVPRQRLALTEGVLGLFQQLVEPGGEFRTAVLRGLLPQIDRLQDVVHLAAPGPNVDQA